jgi:DNA polymerase-3 subunit delta'
MSDTAEGADVDRGAVERGALEQGAGRWGIHDGAPSVLVLQRMIDAGRVPQTLLLSGPPQVGKRRLALSLAQALNCEADSGRPCGDCRSCRRIAEGKHADVEFVSPGGLCRVSDHDHSRSQTIGICAVRRLEMVGVTQPYEGRRQVFIVDPADALSGEASDAFLKTLEEPPASVVFVLVTSRPGLLSETVRSRCRLMTLAPRSVEALTEWLQRERAMPEAEAELVARLARGRIGSAEEALQEGDARALRQAQTAEIRRLSASGRAERFDYAATVAGRAGDPKNARTAVMQWTDWWRDLLLIRVGCGDRVLHRDQQAELEAEAVRYETAQVCGFLLELQRTEELLRSGVNARLALEVLFTQIPTPQALPADTAVRAGSDG